jgi:hypothetical protein
MVRAKAACDGHQTVIAEYTRMLRRPDEISYLVLIVGMAAYRPDEAKALFYAGQKIARLQDEQGGPTWPS